MYYAEGYNNQGKMTGNKCQGKTNKRIYNEFIIQNVEINDSVLSNTVFQSAVSTSMFIYIII